VISRPENGVETAQHLARGARADVVAVGVSTMFIAYLHGYMNHFGHLRLLDSVAPSSPGGIGRHFASMPGVSVCQSTSHGHLFFRRFILSFPSLRLTDLDGVRRLYMACKACAFRPFQPVAR
jgi:hypothetical protein